MMKVLAFCVFTTTVLLSPSRAKAQAKESNLSWVQGGPYQLAIKVFKSDSLSKHPRLVVIIPGDSPFHKPDYQYVFASKVANRTQNVVAVGLLRPGYTDPEGNTSEGERGKMNGDNWNATNTDVIADAISKLESRYDARKVIVAGHSGGAAITANILGRHPKLIDTALLASCPCNVKQWRNNMYQLTGKAVFRGQIKTLSPIKLVENISDQVNIVMVVGSEDKVAPPSLSKHYKAKALKFGKNIRLIQLEGKTHNIFLEPQVVNILVSMLQ